MMSIPNNPRAGGKGRIASLFHTAHPWPALPQHAMRLAAFIVCLLLCIGCGSVRSQKAGAHTEDALVLREYPVEGVKYADGITQAEAELLAASYFSRIVGNCGMPGKPQDRGMFWCVQLRGGIVGRYYGQLRVAKDGSRILLQPPRNGLRSTKELLQRRGITYG